MKLLTQREAATVLRCSVHKIARLRREGALPWLPGRPVKILEKDLERWLSQETQRSQARALLRSARRKTWDKGKVQTPSAGLRNSLRMRVAFGKSAILNRKDMD
jgi:excisionase family DNA binding protein